MAAASLPKKQSDADLNVISDVNVCLRCIYNTLCRNGESGRVNIQLAERFKALDGHECPHKWSDNA